MNMRTCACDGDLGCPEHTIHVQCFAPVGEYVTYCGHCAGDRTTRTCPTCAAVWTIPANAGDGLDGKYCPACPPWECEDCGEPCSPANLCSCWQRFDQMAMADIKAVLAADGFSVGGLGPPDAPGGTGGAEDA